MTREEAIKKLESLKISLPAAKDEISDIIKLIESPWINVKDDLPCNHEELMSKYPFGYKKQTVNVLTFLPNGNVVKDSMGYREKWWNGRQWDGEKWEWESLRRPTHWVPIPKLPKE